MNFSTKFPFSFSSWLCPCTQRPLRWDSNLGFNHHLVNFILCADFTTRVCPSCCYGSHYHGIGKLLNQNQSRFSLFLQLNNTSFAFHFNLHQLLYGTATLATLIGMFQVRHLQYDSLRHFTLDDILLVGGTLHKFASFSFLIRNLFTLLFSFHAFEIFAGQSGLFLYSM